MSLANNLQNEEGQPLCIDSAEKAQQEQGKEQGKKTQQKLTWTVDMRLFLMQAVKLHDLARARHEEKSAVKTLICNLL